MAIYAIINNGIVENMIVADSTFATSIEPDNDFVILADGLDPQPAIGWLYNGSVFENPNKNYAKINSNLVEEIYNLHNDDLAAEQAGNQYVVLIDGLDPQPDIGWGYDGADFSAP